LDAHIRDGHCPESVADMTKLTIRPAQQSDLLELLGLYLHLDRTDKGCPSDTAIGVFEQFLRYAGSAILIGFADERLVTSCTVVVVPNLTRGGTPYALIENVVTHADHRDQGFGKTILAAAVDRAWAAGCYKAMLMTGSKRPSTLAFYEAAGFEQSKTGFQVRRMPARSE
jgi:GNAT superfamily N-acetyltransferase